MIYKRNKIPKKKIAKSLKVYLKHELRNVCKCYTVFNLEIDEENKTLSFNRSFRIRGIRVEDKKLLTGRYDFDPSDDDSEIYIKIFVD